MAYGTLKADVVQSDTAGTPPQFNDGNGTQTGTLCRAWVNFNGTGTVAIRSSFNVSSITDNGTGDYTVNFTNAMPDANYAGVATSSRTAVVYIAGVRAYPINSSSARVQTGDYTATNMLSTRFDHEDISYAVFR